MSGSGGRGVDGRWTGCGRAGAAEIAWEEARDGGAIANVRIRWTGCGRAVDGLWTGGSCRNSMGDGGARANVRIRWTGGGRAVDGRWTGCGRAGAAEIAWEEATK